MVLVFFAKSQKLSDYKYVLVPQEFGDFKESRAYGLSGLLEKSLKAKKYNVLPEIKTEWPQDALMNPCDVVKADLLEDKSMFRNKIILEFRDCNNNSILTEKAGSGIKEFEPGFQDALKQALVKIPVSNPQLQTLAKSEVNNTLPKTVKINSSDQNKTAQRFSNHNLNVQKIQIDDKQFILVDGNSSVPFATFKTTTKQDVFRVKLASGEFTIGYFENGNIIIEMPKGNDEFSKEVFSSN